MDKRKNLPVLVVLMILCLAGLVSAAATFNTPVGSGTIRGTYVFNVSSTLNALKNCSVTGSSSDSSDTLATTYLYNTTEGATWANASVSTAGLNDADDWTFTGTCTNGTDVESITAITAVIVDNTAPTVGTCTIGGVTAANGSVGSSATNVACYVGNATSCTVYWRGSSHAMSSDTTETDCTFTASSSYASAGVSTTCRLSKVGDVYQTWYYTCTDGTNSTTGTGYQIKADGKLITIGKQYTPQQIKTITSNSNQQKLVAIILICVVGAVIVGMLYFNKKKR